MKNTIIISAVVATVVTATYHQLTKNEAEANMTAKTEIDCLARNIFYEAGTENKLGKTAVAQVTLNRVRSGYWGDNICQIVYAGNQFSWTKKSKLEPARGANWDASRDVAREVLYGNLRYSQLKDSLFYHADYTHPNWADPKHRVTKVGRHIFYNQAKGSWVQL